MATVEARFSASSESTQNAPSTVPGTVRPASTTLKAGVSFASGTGADKVNLKYANVFTFVSATPQTIDLSNLLDVYGNAVNFARVKSITIKMYSQTDAATLTIAPGASNGWDRLFAGNVIMRAATATNNSYMQFVAPSATAWAVDSTHKTITFTPSSHAFTVDIEITGCDS